MHKHLSEREREIRTEKGERREMKRDFISKNFYFSAFWGNKFSSKEERMKKREREFQMLSLRLYFAYFIIKIERRRNKFDRKFLRK